MSSDAVKSNPAGWHFSRAEWFALPLTFRRRWWRETDYSRQPPSDQLLADLHILLGGGPAADDLRGLKAAMVAAHPDRGAPKSLALDRWIDEGWHIRRRYDKTGNAPMAWITRDDAISTPRKKKRMVPSPNGKSRVLFCFNDPFPPIEVVLRTYDSLGHGPYAPIAKAKLRRFLA